MLNLCAVLDDAAREVPGRTAVVCGATRLSFAEVDAAASRVANLLVSRGLRPGDKVALHGPNLPLWPVVYYGILRAGCTVVPLNVLLKQREIAYHLADSGATAYVCFDGAGLPLSDAGRAAFEEVPGCEHLIALPAGDLTEIPALADQPDTFESVATQPGDTAVILYTSGTTGRPKGAELTHSSMLHNAMLSARLVDCGRDDVFLVTLPLFHSFGQTCLMNAGFFGHGTLVLLPRFDPAAALRAMRDEGVTVFSGVPTMYWALLGHQDPSGEPGLATAAHRLRAATSGGAALPVEVLRQFRERFGIQILEGYGLSETSPVALFNHPHKPSKPGSVGTPVWGVQVRLVDEQGDEIHGEGPGEIAIRGHNVMKGYHQRPDATAEVLTGGWFRTGDLARRDADGYYFVVDRAKDLIIRGGFNVYPREIEELLMTHPAVSLAAVVGIPDERHGEEIKAFVVPAPGATVTEAELVDWCRESMAAYKYPRSVEFRESLPMNATGKILKRTLRDDDATAPVSRR